MRGSLGESLTRIVGHIRQSAAMEELRGSPTYKPACTACDNTGWEVLTVGRVTTAAGLDVQATPLAPVAHRCPKGCTPPVPNVRRPGARSKHEDL